MKKRIFPILLAALPYLCATALIGVVLMSDASLPMAALWTVPLYLVIALSNCVFAFGRRRVGFSVRQLAFWNMLIKLIHIPFYLFVFCFGLLAIFVFIKLGLVLAVFLFILDCFFLIASSVYGLSALHQARKQRMIGFGSTVMHVLFHFVFCLDVVSAVMLYRKVKKFPQQP